MTDRIARKGVASSGPWDKMSQKWGGDPPETGPILVPIFEPELEAP